MRREDDPINKLFKGINDMAQELNQVEALRQEFISNVSHEIQSPLTSIRGFARALQNDQLSAQDRDRYLGIIQTESMRLSKLSDNLLALAALESDTMRFEPQPYRLDRQIRKLVLVCERQWTAKNIDMEVTVDELNICADEDLLSQFWVNLLHNAIKFTPQDGRVCINNLHKAFTAISNSVSPTTALALPMKIRRACSNASTRPTNGRQQVAILDDKIGANPIGGAWR